MTTQQDIFGGQTLSISPTVFVRKFINKWNSELEAVGHQEPQAKQWFAQFVYTELGATEETIRFLCESRTIRELQDQLTEIRKHR